MTLEQIKSELENVVNVKPTLKANKEWTLRNLNAMYCSDRISGYEVATDTKYFNVRIYLHNTKGCVRVYEKDKELIVQIMRPITMQYSGISTFPSARRGKQICL